MAVQYIVDCSPKDRWHDGWQGRDLSSSCTCALHLWPPSYLLEAVHQSLVNYMNVAGTHASNKSVFCLIDAVAHLLSLVWHSNAYCLLSWQITGPPMKSKIKAIPSDIDKLHNMLHRPLCTL